MSFQNIFLFFIVVHKRKTFWSILHTDNASQAQKSQGQKTNKTEVVH